MGWNNWHDWHWGFGYGHWFYGVLIWAVILILLVLLIRGITGGGGDTAGRTGKSALEILEERYARGEIDEQEFQRKKRDIVKS